MAERKHEIWNKFHSKAVILSGDFCSFELFLLRTRCLIGAICSIGSFFSESMLLHQTTWCKSLIFSDSKSPRDKIKGLLKRTFFHGHMSAVEKGEKIDSSSDENVIQFFCLWACEPVFLFTVFWFLINFNYGH